MSDEQDVRIGQLEQDNARLRRLLHAQNVPSTLRHQVRNSLSLMRAVLQRSVNATGSVEDYAAHVEGRFDALLRVQTLLIDAPEDTVSLHSLIADELVAHIIHEGKRASLEGPAVGLGPKCAQVMGLAVHELITNAIKFGAMTAISGRICVRWKILEGADPMLELTWTESGLSAPLHPPKSQGFGRAILENLTSYELRAEGKLEYWPEGVRYALRLPMQQVRQ